MMNLFIPINIPTTLPPNIVRQISRISNIFSNQSIFNSSIPMYKEAPTKNKSNDFIVYTPEMESINSERNKTRNIKIIWFNPRYSLNMETSIGKTFLKLAKKDFPHNDSFHKILKKNTIKISYSCMKNINSIIASHGKSILHLKAKEHGCN